MLLWRYMAIVALLAIASIPWLATAQATGKLVGYTNTAAVPALEQVSTEESGHVRGVAMAYVLLTCVAMCDPPHALHNRGLSMHVRCIRGCTCLGG
jgi:hypothetical protein